MEKLYVCILSLLTIVLFSCNTQQDVDLLGLSGKEKVSKIEQLEYDRGFHYQASAMRQAYTDSLIVLDPKNAGYYSDKSIAHSKIGDYHISFPLLQKAMELDPKETLYYTSWLMTDLYKDYDRALEYLTQYDNYTPDKTDYAWGNNVNFLKGEVLQAIGRHEEAIIEFTKAIDAEGLDYVDTSCFPYRGISYSELEKYDQAIADFDQGIALYGKSSMAYYYKGLTLLKINKKEEAINNIQKARDLVAKGHKKSDPYKEVYNEIYLMQIEDKLKELGVDLK